MLDAARDDGAGAAGLIYVRSRLQAKKLLEAGVNPMWCYRAFAHGCLSHWDPEDNFLRACRPPVAGRRRTSSRKETTHARTAA